MRRRIAGAAPGPRHGQALRQAVLETAGITPADEQVEQDKRVAAIMETRDVMLEYLTAAAALVAAAASLWNTYQFAKLSGRKDAAERAHNAHVNAPGLHGIR